MNLNRTPQLASRLAGVLVLAGVLIGMTTGTASANPPTITREGPFPEDLIDTSCGFDVRVQDTVSLIDIVWTDSAGTPVKEHLSFPHTIAYLTNVQTDRSIRVNFSGPIAVRYDADGNVVV